MLRSVGENYSEVRPAVRRAVDEERTTVTLPGGTPARSRQFVERDGAFYTVRASRTGRVPTGWGWREPPRTVVGAIRLGGVALLVHTGGVSVE